MKNNLTWFIYIVRCDDGTLYTGATPNVKKRLAAHNDGLGAKYTRSRLPVQLLHVEACPDQSAALKREREIKHFSRAQKLLLIAAVTRVVKKRLLAIDIAKGIAILSMVVLHYLFVLSELQLIDRAMIESLPYLLISRVVAITFIALSTAVLWSRSQTITPSRVWLVNTAKQVLKISLAALVVTLATKLWLDQTYVRFGILHFLAVATLINSLLFRLHLSRRWYMVFGLSLLLIGNWLLLYSYPVYGWEWLGITPDDFISIDYVPILPWLGLSWLTVPFIQRILSWSKIVQPQLEHQKNWRWLYWCGRHSLSIYLLHIPMLFATLSILQNLF